MPEINEDDFDLISDGNKNTYYFGFTQYVNAYITRTESDEVVVRYFYKNDGYRRTIPDFILTKMDLLVLRQHSIMNGLQLMQVNIVLTGKQKFLFKKVFLILQ